MDDMRDRVRQRQKLEAHGDGTIRIARVKDAHFVNTDHVHVWYEPVGNYSCGKKDSGQKNIKTGGKEKDRFPAQFSITKDGKKLIPFLIFKGELTFTSLYDLVDNTS